MANRPTINVIVRKALCALFSALVLFRPRLKAVTGENSELRILSVVSRVILEIEEILRLNTLCPVDGLDSSRGLGMVNSFEALCWLSRITFTAGTVNDCSEILGIGFRCDSMGDLLSSAEESSSLKNFWHKGPTQREKSCQFLLIFGKFIKKWSIFCFYSMF